MNNPTYSTDNPPSLGFKRDGHYHVYSTIYSVKHNCAWIYTAPRQVYPGWIGYDPKRGFPLDLISGMIVETYLTRASLLSGGSDYLTLYEAIYDADYNDFIPFQPWHITD